MTTGFLLHSRPYRESSSLLSFFLEHDGRIDVVARASRDAGKKSQQSPLLFTPYDVHASGKGDLRQLLHCEPAGSAFALQGQSLYCGLYINELLYRLLPRYEPELTLYQSYRTTLRALVADNSLEPCLRAFELVLLDAIGYGLSLQHDIHGLPLETAKQYLYIPERGLESVDCPQPVNAVVGSGAAFLAIGANNFEDVEVRQLAKKLLRVALAIYLGNKPLHSRKLFVSG